MDALVKDFTDKFRNLRSQDGSEEDRFNFGISLAEKLVQNLKNIQTPVAATDTGDGAIRCADCQDRLETIGLTLNQTNSRTERREIIGSIPLSLSSRKASRKFNVSRNLVLKAKKIRADPNRKQKRTAANKIPDDTLSRTHSFFTDDHQVSRAIPNTNLARNVVHPVSKEKSKEGGYLMQMTLKEAYQIFLKKNPDLKISFSKFKELRPKNVRLAMDKGMANGCLCEIHCNMTFLAKAIDPTGNLHYSDLLNYFVCDASKKDCMLRTCEGCRETTGLPDELVDRFRNDGEVTFQWWSDGTLSEVRKPPAEFIDLCNSTIEKFLPHSFVARHQFLHFETTKDNLDRDEVLILSDFAQNYSFITQNEVQSAYWKTKEQSSLIPFVVFYRAENTDQILHRSIMVVTSDLKHDSALWACAREVVIASIRRSHPNVRKVHYFTDGAAGHFKNLNSLGLFSQHLSLFNLEAEWSFFGTGHGKSSCDAISGACKRLAREQSLRAIDISGRISSPLQLYNFLKEKCPKITFFFLDSNETQSQRQKLLKDFQKSKPIKGIRSLHYFQLVQEGVVLAARLPGDPFQTLDLRRTTQTLTTRGMDTSS